ncbi:MAG: hypothetical protein ACTSSQ_01075 [Alphaproteobacteria bacterium]
MNIDADQARAILRDAGPCKASPAMAGWPEAVRQCRALVDGKLL